MKWKEYSDGDEIHQMNDISKYSYQIVEGSIEFLVKVSSGENKISKTFYRGEICGMVRRVNDPRK